MCCRYMRESGAEWDEMAPMQAAGNGKIECMEYAKEKVLLLPSSPDILL